MAEEPQSYHDRILSYLREHEEHPEMAIPSDQVFPTLQPRAAKLAEDTGESESQAEYILKEILLKLNTRITCKDRYENLKYWHNQFPLFNMEDFIPEFCIDEEMIEKLSFRESLLISELDSEHKDSRECTPNPVGALCLNIEAVRAILPEGLKKPSTDEELELQVVEALQRAKKMAGPLTNSLSDGQTPRMNMEEIEIALQKKVEEYENLLKAEMYENAIKFVVHLSSQFSLGFNAGSRITAWVDRNLHTLEEKRTEYAEKLKEQLDEKSLYIALQNKKYYLKHHSSKEGFEDKKCYSLAKTRNLICEGANFVLMRYLAITKYVGNFELSTTYINGDMCRNIYECTGPMKGIVNNKKVDICKIYRYIIEECGLEHHCVTVMTVHGRIVTQEWDGCKIIINMNPLQHIKPGEPSPYDRLCLHKTWYDDMELFSKYLDAKTQAELKMKTYATDHPEVKDFLADYLNNILLLKPQNILSFTVDFFQSVCPMKMAKMGYEQK